MARHRQTLTSLIIGSLSAALWLSATLAQAATPASPPAKAQAMPMADMHAGACPLMTDKEHTLLRARLWAAQTDAERERIRAEQHEAMTKRAQDKGVTMPGMKGMAACSASAPACPMQMQNHPAGGACRHHEKNGQHDRHHKPHHGHRHHGDKMSSP